MKVAIIDELFGFNKQGCPQNINLNFSRYLKNNNIQNKIFSFSDVKTFIPSKMKMFHTLRDLLIVPYLGINLIKKAEKESDILHLTLTTTTSFYKPKVPSVIFCHSLFSRQVRIFTRELPLKYKIFYNSLTYFLFKYLEKKAINNASAVVVTKKEIKYFLINNLNISKNKIFVIPQGIDLSLFKPLKCNNKSKALIFVGRGTIAKGFNLLLDISDKINSNIFVISTRINPSYRKILKIKSNVNLIFNVPHKNIVKYYQDSSILFMPSLCETGPIVTLEAMAMGLSVICTSEGGGDFVKNNINGYLISKENPSEIIIRINNLLSSSKVLQKFKKNNLRDIKKYDIKKTFSDLVELYESLLEMK